ncbi:MAG: hypothetical protein WBC92_11165, partial [Terracidiphilus sp.]
SRIAADACIWLMAGTSPVPTTAPLGLNPPLLFAVPAYAPVPVSEEPGNVAAVTRFGEFSQALGTGSDCKSKRKPLANFTCLAPAAATWPQFRRITRFMSITVFSYPFRLPPR